MDHLNIGYNSVNLPKKSKSKSKSKNKLQNLFGSINTFSPDKNKLNSSVSHKPKNKSPMPSQQQTSHAQKHKKYSSGQYSANNKHRKDSEETVIVPNQKQIKQLFGKYRILANSLKNSSNRLNNIGNAYIEIKNHFKLLSNDIEGLNVQFNFTDNTEIHKQNNIKILQNLSNNHQIFGKLCLQYGNNISHFIDRYVGLMKKKYTKFLQQSQNLSHYRDKLDVLKGGSQFNRLERNKGKLNTAQRQYASIAVQLNSNLWTICEQGSNMLNEYYIDSMASVLDKYRIITKNIQDFNTIKNASNFSIENSSGKKDDLDNLFDGNQCQEIYCISDGDNSEHYYYKSSSKKVDHIIDYQAEIKKILTMNPKKYTQITQQNIQKYFGNIRKFKMQQNVFQNFDEMHNITPKTKKRLQKQQHNINNESKFSRFHNVFSHKNKKNHYELNQVVVKAKYQEPNSAHGKIRIKQIIKLDEKKLQAKQQSYGFDYFDNLLENKQDTVKSTNNTQNKPSNFNNKAVEYKNIKNDDRADNLPKPKRKQSVDLLDLAFQ